MPFDFAPTKPDSEVVTMLRKARALIEDRSNWRPKAAMGGPFCTLGAIWHVADAAEVFSGEIQEIFRRANGIPEFGDIGNWNDAQTHEGVLSGFDRAIILAGGTP
jgi:hypothetical protein